MGDFGRHFTLYVPVGFEKDALCVFTPDLMAALIDSAPGAFVEMRNKHMTVGFPRVIDFARESEWLLLSGILAGMGAKVVRRTSLYIDGPPRQRRWTSESRLAMPPRVSAGAVIAAAFLLLHLIPLLWLLVRSL